MSPINRFHRRNITTWRISLLYIACKIVSYSMKTFQCFRFKLFNSLCLIKSRLRFEQLFVQHKAKNLQLFKFTVKINDKIYLLKFFMPAFHIDLPLYFLPTVAILYVGYEFKYIIISISICGITPNAGVFLGSLSSWEAYQRPAYIWGCLHSCLTCFLLNRNGGAHSPPGQMRP